MNTPELRELLYRDLRDIPVTENGEALVMSNTYDPSIRLGTGYKIQTPKDAPEQVFMVRDSVAQKLSRANGELRKKNYDRVLEVGYGFRPMEIQKVIFNRVYDRIRSTKNDIDELEILEQVHKFIAVPEVSGHSTGGAVDLTIFDSERGVALDMGYPMLDLDGDEVEMSWRAKNLSRLQQENRDLLFELMTGENFAPFWGEWWHYSYGDREWAAYYERDQAIYEQRLFGKL